MDLTQRMGENWQQMALHVRNLDVKPVAEFLGRALQSTSSNYRIVQRSMEEFCFSQVSDEERLDFILLAVQLLQGQEQHLLLDLIRPGCEDSATQQQRQHAVALFWDLLYPAQRPQDGATPDPLQPTQPATATLPPEGAPSPVPMPISSATAPSPRMPAAQGNSRSPLPALAPHPAYTPPLTVNTAAARVAVKLCNGLDLTVDELGGVERVRQEFMEPLLRLTDPGGSTTSASYGRIELQSVYMMARREPRLLDGVDCADTLAEAAASGQRDGAIELAQLLGHRQQEAFMQGLVDAGKLKAAALAVRALQLTEEFPEVEPRYRRATVRQLLARGRWGVAVDLAQHDKALQLEVLHALVEAGEVGRAQESLKLYGLPEGALQADVSDEALQAERRRKLDQFIQCSMHVTFVSEAAQLPSVRATLRSATCVAVDVEWKPAGLRGAWGDKEGKGGGNGDGGRPSTREDPAALLQLAVWEEAVCDPAAGSMAASAAQAGVALADGGAAAPRNGSGEAVPPELQQPVKTFVIDLLALGEVPELGATLAPVLLSPDVPVVGLELAGDLRKLTKSYPSVAAFQIVLRTLDLRGLWDVYALRTGVPRRVNGNRKGLSGLSEAVLGKPMDKAMQTSDWSRRPLSPQQLHYAALDAAVQVHLLVRMCRTAAVTAAELRALCSDWRGGGAGADVSGDDSNDSSGGGGSESDGGNGGGNGAAEEAAQHAAAAVGGGGVAGGAGGAAGVVKAE
eukprot:jgi/Ulvmu1/3523/UM163_0004.1